MDKDILSERRHGTKFFPELELNIYTAAQEYYCESVEIGGCQYQAPKFFFCQLMTDN